MSETTLNAVRGVLLAVVTALVTAGVIDPGLSDAIVGVLSALAVLVGVVAIKRPKDSA